VTATRGPPFSSPPDSVSTGRGAEGPDGGLGHGFAALTQLAGAGPPCTPTSVLAAWRGQGWAPVSNAGARLGRGKVMGASAWVSYPVGTVG
jgi:hypothetical protein